MERYDAIIIGSGLGGLTAGALLARGFNKRVLILEQHFKIGGFTHDFKRIAKSKEYVWDVGLHYVGNLGEGTLTRRVFDYITDNQLKWKKMTDRFEHFVYPDFTFTESSDAKTFKEELIAKFPNEKKAISTYFKDLEKACSWYIRDYLIKFFPAWIGIWIRMVNVLSRKLALSTTKEYMDSHFNDKQLKSLLTSQWGDYGLPPSKSSFAIHALVVQNYMDGAYFPIGGGGEIARTMIPVIEKKGGACLINHTVSEIVIENGKATGVKAIIKKGDKTTEKAYQSNTIISNVGALNTFTKLLPKEVRHSKNDEIINFTKGYSSCTLYVGLKESAEKLNIKGENYWIYDSYNHEEAMVDPKSIQDSGVKFAYLSFPSIKNPTSKGHTAEIIGFLQYDAFTTWKNQKWMNRAQEYKELKEQITNRYIEFIDKHIKGFKDLIAYAELSTPLTIEHFTHRQNGEMYGIPATPQRHAIRWLKPKTEIKNLYLTGSDVCSLGIQGALFGGLAAASVLSGALGFFKITGKIKKAVG